MPVKINVGLSRKVGQQNFGSLGATCNVEFELDGGYDNGSTERFQDAVKRAFASCRQAVEAELGSHVASQPGSMGGKHVAAPVNRIADQQQSGSHPRGATEGQVRAIYAISKRNSVQLAGMLGAFKVTRPEDLSIQDASSLIDQLKNPARGVSAAGR